MKPSNSDVAFFFGTSAELIKLWPVIANVQTKTKVSLLTSNQQPSEVADLVRLLQLPEPIQLRSAERGNLVSKSQVLPWFISVSLKSLKHLYRLRRNALSNGRRLLVVVHGDTMTCVLGALMGKVLRCDVVHIEAGLRSHDWKNPFPEEIDRIITARLADIHFAPDDVAVRNLSRVTGVVVNTKGNTSRDSMRLVQAGKLIQQTDFSFALVSLHRAELVSNQEVFARTISELIDAAESKNVIMVVDALTREALTQNNLMDALVESKVDVRDKMPYPEFLKLVVASSRVVTDSGGLQEECGFLSIPCLVHRKATERFDGIGETAKLSMWRTGEIYDFLNVEDPVQDSVSERLLTEGDSPTEVIAHSLIQLGYF